MKGFALIATLALVFLIGAAIAGPGDEADTLKAAPEGDASAQKLEMKVKEIFGKSCATSGCHGGEHPKMDLSLEADDIPANMIGVPSRQNSKLMLIDTKDPSQSYLLLKMTGGKGGIKGKKMPIMKKPLTEEEMTTVTMWIEEARVPAPLSAPTINQLVPSPVKSEDDKDD